MSRRVRSRYPHAFSKGRGVAVVADGSRRAALRDGRPMPLRGPWIVQTQSLGRAMTGPAAGGGPHYPIALDPKRWPLLKVSPTVANLYEGHIGLAMICADCLHGVGHRNPGLPDYFRRQWHLTLLELEKKCRCARCGSRNARVYPWWGGEGGALGLDGPPTG